MDKTQKLGPYLLSGWTMLQEACADCLLPLVRSKKKEIICANCLYSFTEDGEKIQKPVQVNKDSPQQLEKPKQQIAVSSEEKKKEKYISPEAILIPLLENKIIPSIIKAIDLKIESSSSITTKEFLTGLKQLYNNLKHYQNELAAAKKLT